MNEVPESILAKIQEAKEKHLKELDLSDEGLTYIPTEVFKLTELEVLSLYDNELTTIPGMIG